MSKLKLSIVIPSWNTEALLRTCLASIEAAPKPPTEVIVIDNDSADGSADMVAKEFPTVKLQRNERNEGFAIACNQGAHLATGEYLLLLNADTEIRATALNDMTAFLEAHAEYAAVAPRLIHPDGRTQPTCMAFPSMWTPLFFGTVLERMWPRSPEMRRYFMLDWNQEDERDVEQPPAACFTVRRAIFEELDGFDEDLWLFFNDVDLSKRLEAKGWKTRYLGHTEVVHIVGASTSQYGRFLGEWHRNRLTYYRKHFGALAGPWLKCCVSLSIAEHGWVQMWRRLRGRDYQPFGEVFSTYLQFLKL